MIKSFTTVSGLIFLSRLLGCAREILIASFIGPGPIADAFFLGFRLPNTFRRLFAEGAFNSAFVPLFTKIWCQDTEKATRFASNALSYLTFALIFLTAFFEVLMPVIMKGLAAGFKDTEKFKLVVYFARIMFPYILLVSLSSLFMSILNSLQFFGAASASSVILNINAVVCLALFSAPPLFAAEALSWSIPVSGTLQLVFIYCVCRRHIKIQLWMPKWTSTIRQLFKKMLPGIYGAGVYQINMISSDIIASFIPSAISYLAFADRINQFPLGLIGAAMGVVTLPTLAKHFSKNNHTAAMDTQNQAMSLSLFLSIPAAVGLFILAEPIIRTLYQHKQFSSNDALATSACLKAFVLGLPAFVLVKILTNNFFARGDTKTPVKITSFILLLNITLNLILSHFYSYVGIALGTSTSYWVQVMILCVLLKRLSVLSASKLFLTQLLRILAATTAMGSCLLALKTVPFFQQEKSIVMTGTFLVCGLFFYLIFCEIFGLRLKKIFKKDPLHPQETP